MIFNSSSNNNNQITFAPAIWWRNLQVRGLARQATTNGIEANHPRIFQSPLEISSWETHGDAVIQCVYWYGASIGCLRRCIDWVPRFWKMSFELECRDWGGRVIETEVLWPCLMFKQRRLQGELRLHRCVFAWVVHTNHGCCLCYVRPLRHSWQHHANHTHLCHVTEEFIKNMGNWDAPLEDWRAEFVKVSYCLGNENRRGWRWTAIFDSTLASQSVIVYSSSDGQDDRGRWCCVMPYRNNRRVY